MTVCSCIQLRFRSTRRRLQPSRARRGQHREALTYSASSELGRKGKPSTAQALARTTGGVVAGFLTVKSLERVIANLGEELHSQYLLSFTPAVDVSHGLHRIQVKVRNRDDLLVRARPGYVVE